MRIREMAVGIREVARVGCSRRIGPQARRVTKSVTNREGGDNHWFDCVVGCAVAACMQGSALPEHTPQLRPPRPKVKLSDLVRQKRAKREEREHRNTGGWVW